MDSGANASIIHTWYIGKNKLMTRKTSTKKLPTMFGSLLTSCKAEDKIKLLKLNIADHIFAPFHVTSQKSNHNVFFFC